MGDVTGQKYQKASEFQLKFRRVSYFDEHQASELKTTFFFNYSELIEINPDAKGPGGAKNHLQYIAVYMLVIRSGIACPNIKHLDFEICNQNIGPIQKMVGYRFTKAKDFDFEYVRRWSNLASCKEVLHMKSVLQLATRRSLANIPVHARSYTFMRAGSSCLLGKTRCLSSQQQPKDIPPPPLKGWETERFIDFLQRGGRLKV
ncbi:hypothetical protein RhiirA4_465845 [Rhizophagus irregularis]|uniref:Uncharacterized protein n=1 Tax=Rhizophagus irregularis TaxID=588596 RepID=A0A2I1GSW6_9GLOM|nr:hypothetical protein RhiirA4_465845 [Rhizophagus irregularis]